MHCLLTTTDSSLVIHLRTMDSNSNNKIIHVESLLRNVNTVTEKCCVTLQAILKTVNRIVTLKPLRYDVFTWIFSHLYHYNGNGKLEIVRLLMNQYQKSRTHLVHGMCMVAAQRLPFHVWFRMVMSYWHHTSNIT